MSATAAKRIRARLIECSASGLAAALLEDLARARAAGSAVVDRAQTDSWSLVPDLALAVTRAVAAQLTLHLAGLETGEAIEVPTLFNAAPVVELAAVSIARTRRRFGAAGGWKGEVVGGSPLPPDGGRGTIQSSQLNRSVGISVAELGWCDVVIAGKEDKREHGQPTSHEQSVACRASFSVFEITLIIKNIPNGMLPLGTIKPGLFW
jgi:hypothetical protein